VSESITPEHNDMHRSHRAGWLRAAVLGANDGIVSTASLLIGVAAASADQKSIILAGVAGLFAGSLSMAAGEYVSVHTQRDTEKADLELELKHLREEPEFELKELTEIYIGRGLEPALAGEVARQLMEHDALGAHARDELGITEVTSARPLQAAVSSAISFAIGAFLPILMAWLAGGTGMMISIVAISSLVFLAGLGALSAWAGGAGLVKGSIRVLLWGSIAMVVTAIVGLAFGAVA
jgi:VIT1/CCC1 family predicted Fe2+/Mn2+ transporter